MLSEFESLNLTEYNLVNISYIEIRGNIQMVKIGDNVYWDKFYMNNIDFYDVEMVSGECLELPYIIDITILNINFYGLKMKDTFFIS